MSVIFNICLPVETIAAIQRGESEIILSQLSAIPDGHYRLLHDVARNVVTAVNAMPCNLVPKAAPVNLSATAPVFWPTTNATLNYGSPTRSPTICTPASVTYGQASAQGGGWGSASHARASFRDDTEVSFTIRDLMMKEEHFCVSSRTPFEEVARTYNERTNTLRSTLTFSIDDMLIDDHHEMVHWVGVKDGSIITAKPRLVDDSQTMTVTFQDLMMRNAVLDVSIDALSDDLLDAYADWAGLDYSDLSFTYEGQELHASGWGQPTSLKKLRITTGSIVKVAPKQEITVVFRDQMLREDRIKIKDSDDFESLVLMYQDKVGPSTEVYYSLSNGVNVHSGSSIYCRSIKTLRITDGSFINVHPVSNIPKAARAGSLATGFSDCAYSDWY
ncbi:hypothetical protein LTR36_002355 [Oleoguttula mirabilis]|uniref:Uncharacterized protein n=1 Tax=Oleoguttula mirabilis TaxID=1507867 RepID=A0AAV9JNU5_9PEZI|nr:hypothetical protein LTR36_002355 [Oleoguttula mirabilis]